MPENTTQMPDPPNTQDPNRNPQPNDLPGGENPKAPDTYPPTDPGNPEIQDPGRGNDIPDPDGGSEIIEPNRGAEIPDAQRDPDMNPRD